MSYGLEFEGMIRGLSYKDIELQKEKQEVYNPQFMNIISTDTMPCIPVNPKKFVVKVKAELKKKKVCFSKGTSDVIEGMCKLFNDNIKGDTSNLKSYFYAAETGIGKSLSLQVYVSMLKKESSLIIVSRVQEAIEYCKYINQLSGDIDYARCYYAESEKNKKNLLRVEKYHLKQYRCIIITHNMFKKVNQSNNLNLYRLYKGASRDLVVIDERISFYTQYSVTIRDLDNLLYQIEYISQNSPDIKLVEDNDTAYKFLHALKVFFIDLSKTIDIKYSATELVKRDNINEYISSKGLDVTKSIELLKLIFETRVEELFSELKQIGHVSNKSYQNVVLNNVHALIDNIQTVLQEDFIYYKSNYMQSFFTVKNIAYKLGKSVVLDATANINEFYQVANRYKGIVAQVKVKRIRKYENLTIYKAEGYKQSRSAIYKQDTMTVEKNANMYLSHAYNILTQADDKMLIVCHKDFLLTMEKNCQDSRIVFTYWGNHIGKNDWSDCNKVMIVGWNYIDPIGSIANFYNAINSISKGSRFIDNDIITSFAISQLADDLVQAVMRSRARVIATEDSDCYETEIYLYYDGLNDNHYDTLELFESQFPEARIVDWLPIGLPPVKKKTKPEKKIDEIISLLKSKEKDHQTYLLSDVKKETEIYGANMTRLTKTDYFNEQLKINNYIFRKKNGKSMHFILG